MSNTENDFAPSADFLKILHDLWNGRKLILTSIAAAAVALRFEVSLEAIAASAETLKPATTGWLDAAFEVFETLDKMFKKGERPDQLEFKAYFGQVAEPSLKPLARAVFERFAAPVVSVTLKHLNGHWVIAELYIVDHKSLGIKCVVDWPCITVGNIGATCSGFEKSTSVRSLPETPKILFCWLCAN